MLPNFVPTFILLNFIFDQSDIFAQSTILPTFILPNEAFYPLSFFPILLLTFVLPAFILPNRSFCPTFLRGYRVLKNMFWQVLNHLPNQFRINPSSLSQKCWKNPSNADFFTRVQSTQKHVLAGFEPHFRNQFPNNLSSVSEKCWKKRFQS